MEPNDESIMKLSLVTLNKNLARQIMATRFYNEQELANAKVHGYISGASAMMIGHRACKTFLIELKGELSWLGAEYVSGGLERAFMANAKQIYLK